MLLYLMGILTVPAVFGKPTPTNPPYCFNMALYYAEKIQKNSKYPLTIERKSYIIEEVSEFNCKQRRLNGIVKGRRNAR